MLCSTEIFAEIDLFI